MPPHKGIFFEIFCQIPLHRASNKQKGGRTWPRIWSSCTAATIRRCTATLCGSPAANTPPRSWRRRPFTGPWWPCRISGASAPPPPGCARSPGTPGPPCGGRRAGASPWTEPYREVFLLRVLGELSFRDIGSLFEKGENWACVTYHRARKKIMEQMEGTP